MASGYTRQSSATIIDGGVVTAASFNDEYDAIQAAFDGALGHAHDGTGGQGGRILVVGPAGELVVSGTGANPKTGATYDLGTTGTRWRDLWLSRNATVGGTLGVTGAVTLSSTLAVTGNATVAGTLAVTGVVSGGAATAGTHLLNRDTADARYALSGSSASFSGAVTVGDATAATHAMNRQSSDARYLQLAGTQTVTGTATFSNPVTVGTASAGGHAVNRTAGDARYLQLSGGTLTGTLTGTDITLSNQLTAVYADFSNSIATRSSGNAMVRFGNESTHGSVTIGTPNRSTSGSPFIEFYSSALHSTADVKLTASGGTASFGKGLLTITADAGLVIANAAPLTCGQVSSGAATGLIVSGTTNPGGTSWLQVLAQGNPNWETINLQTVSIPGSLYYGARIGVGTTTARSFDFLSTGNATAPGSWQNGSDSRVKANKVSIADALSKVSLLTGYTYDRTDLGSRDAGLLAQDVRSVLPEAVSAGAYPPASDPTGEPFLSLNYSAVIALLVNAVKELKADLAAANARIDGLA